VTLDVFSDIACPWCFIGKRRLEAALAGEPAGAVQVRWRAYQLMPDLPPEGLEATAYFRKRFGSDQQIREMHERVAAIGAGEGIHFAFEKRGRLVNTRLGHQLVKLAERRGLADQAVEALFRANFEEGADVSVLDEALAVFERQGVAIDPLALRAEVAEGEGLAAVLVDLNLGRQLGVSGVPFFLGNGVVAVSGAQDTAVLRRFLQVAREKATQLPA
jgi:predicted DsbA family dithiol-disulfide isomerase